MADGNAPGDPPKAGGFKLSFAGAKNKPGLKGFGQKQAAQKPVNRALLALGDEEPEEANKKEEISGWDAEGGALGINGKKKDQEEVRVIPAQPNRNWREESKRKQIEKEQKGAANAELIPEPSIGYGLVLPNREEGDEETLPDAPPIEPQKPQDDGLTEEERLEKRALEALMTDKITDDTVIPLHETEEEAFHNDYHKAPDAPSLSAYEATPIDGFGAALLRGMGWKDGDTIGKNGKPLGKPKEVKRRPALLGIGAKDEAATGVELGEWGKGAKKIKQSYNPVTLRNKTTGEMITEEELKARLEKQSFVEDKGSRKESRNDYEYEDSKREKKYKERRDDHRRGDDYDTERRRDKDRRDDRRRDKTDDYDSERRRDRDRRDDRRRDDDYDSERRREKRKDKERRGRSRSPEDDDRRDRKRDKDRRDRDRDDDDRRERRRDRDRRERSRSRDSDDRRKRRRDYEDDRDDRKRKYKDDKYYRK
ncbi:hypothetical protein BS50DRAFT_575644 [Corynespora cassiicola Philippines]|uniref:Pre-mRNA-splicing factor n=1 Tax=Corynespora cassiicola Philippines TaxID=1448308 RepID=A0A2T2NKT4_CORCC|nr:hypothetical protein BS50DRAFT_575644 [Corynespora cassiicola Philippines]